MDQQGIRDIMSGARRGLGPGLLRAALHGASLPYGALMRFRRWAYRRGVVPSSNVRDIAPARAAAGRHPGPVGIPVISVGNITTGGTGKTPMVAWVVARLREMGRTPAILTRGYKAVKGRSDEAQMLGQLCGAPVVVNDDRVAGARAAIDQGADVLVMDDGFQHRRLQRDLDIVLIDGTNPFGYGYCLPRGLLREGPWALRDAGAIVITRSDRLAPDRLERLRNRLFALAPRAGIHLAVHAPTGVIDEKGERLPPSWLCDKTVFAFCGIANPSSFFETLTSLGAQLAGAVALDDHVDYSPEVLERLRQEAARCKGQVLMTTQKDFVKLTGADLGAPVLQLAVEMQIVGGQAELLERIKAACEGQ